MSGRLVGQHVFVTGGANGIGAAIVQKCTDESASVTFLDLNIAAGESLASTLRAAGKNVHFVSGDVTKLADIKRAHIEGVQLFGKVSGLVNNAGRNSYADAVEMTEEQWDSVFAVDLKAAWLCCKVMLPDMVEAQRGSIVNIASIHANMTFPGYFPYAAAKSGLIGLTRSLALDAGPNQVRVNALSPGFTNTALVADYFKTVGQEELDRTLGVHALRRIGEPSEIASVASFLLSDEASFVTGAQWLVDGGLSVRYA